MLSKRAYSGLVPKKDRVWLRAAIKFAQDEELKTRSLERAAVGGKRPTSFMGRTPDRFLVRRRISQGPPYKCPLIRELLWDWFVDIRSSLCTTISAKFVLMKARQIAETVLQEQRRLGEFGSMPNLDRHWLLRWKRDKGVVFRRPNMRFKCSKPVLLKRLRAMWRNVIVVRQLAVRLLGHDVAHSMYGIDEKPIHFNEAGSKNVRTLELVGAPAVRLKQNHANTRERASWMTTVTSNKEAASQPRFLPSELLYKARSAARTRKLRLPADVNISVQWATKGSYREDHILQFLRSWLDPWTDEREKAGDFRILLMDVAKSHLAERIVEFAWSRGYVTLFHYGCTTGVAQVNDTDLHGALERVYLEIEQASFNEQQLYEPGCVNRRPQDVLDDAVCAWKQLDHTAGVAGHWRNGLSNKLDGSEDHLITREARLCWADADMASERLRAIAAVNAAVDAKEVESFAEWRNFVVHPEDAGVQLDEGAELEGHAEPGEAPWLTEEDEKMLAEDDAAVLSMASNAGTEGTVVVEAAEGDDKDELEEATAGAQRLEKLKKLRQGALEAKVPAAFFNVDREIVQLQRGLRDSKKGKNAVNKILRRAVEKAADKQASEMRSARAKARAKMEAARQVRAKAAKAAKAKKAAADAKKALQKKIEELPQQFDAASCGDKAKGYKARKDCLERLKLRSPDLPFEEEARWSQTRDAFARRYPKLVKGAAGAQFIHEINGVLKGLAQHYNGKTKYNAKGESDGKADAFLKFVRDMKKRLPKPAVAAVL